MPIRVQLPDGSMGEFPDGMSDAEIEGVLQKQYAPQPAAPVTPAPKMAQSKGGIGDAVSNVGQHLKNLVAGPYHAFTDAPADDAEKSMGAGPGRGLYRMMAKPTVDAIGDAIDLRKKGGPHSSLWNPSTYDEQGNNVPTAGSKIIDAIPIIGPWARNFKDEQHQKGMLPAVAGFAADVLAPKGMGLVGKGVGKMAGKVAPALAETALRVRATDRAHLATPGRAALDHTSGFSPAKIAESARDSLKSTQAEAGNMVNNALGDVDLMPTRGHAIDALGRAIEENHPETIRRLEDLTDQVVTDQTTKKPIPQHVSPRKAQALNRGLANAKTSWNPATANDSMNATAGKMHHELGEGIAQQVPGIRPLNQRMQSLFPVIQRGTAADLNAGVVQRLSGRIGAHTGALAGGLAGYNLGGIPGAVAGFVLPELIASPEAQMGAARGVNAVGRMAKSPNLPKATRMSSLVAPRKKKDDR